MQQTIRNAIQVQPAHRASRFKIPRLWFIVPLLVIGLLLAVIVVSMLAKRLSEVYLSSPFAAVTAVFPGQPLDARQLETEGFSCWLDLKPAPTDLGERCLRDLPTGPFSQIDIIIWDGIIRWVNFAVRENALTVGDLALLWGKPEVEINSSLMIVRWSHHRVVASGSSLNGRFTYFQPLSAISFAIET